MQAPSHDLLEIILGIVEGTLHRARGILNLVEG